MNSDKLKEVLESEPVYRTKQVKQVIFRDLIEEWDEAITLPKELREKLKAECKIEIENELKVAGDNKSSKALIKLEDGQMVETVLMRHAGGRNTVCVSSQIGCPLACAFCATGKMGFKRDLKYYEIVEQVLFWSRLLKKEMGSVTNIVFMGMGEPFLNYDNVLGAIRVLNDKDGFNLGIRKFSISTAGITEGIIKLAEEELAINLAISLHAPDDTLRQKLMPIGKKYTIKNILDAVDYYIEKTHRRVMFEYIMIDGVNDSEREAKELVKLLRGKLCFVNLIPYNETDMFKGSPDSRITKFKNILMEKGIQAIQRYRFGADIDAACGQLARKRSN
jgi:23S rRNA (adenine2503-C2)-methyltransferase